MTTRPFTTCSTRLSFPPLFFIASAPLLLGIDAVFARWMLLTPSWTMSFMRSPSYCARLDADPPGLLALRVFFSCRSSPPRHCGLLSPGSFDDRVQLPMPSSRQASDPPGDFFGGLILDYSVVFRIRTDWRCERVSFCDLFPIGCAVFPLRFFLPL